MASERKFGLALLVCTLLFCGCQSGRAKVKEVPRTPTDKKKAELLKRIDRKFEDAEAHYELGTMYQADGLWSQAEYEYNTTLSFDPVHRGAQAATVKVLMESGDTNKSHDYVDIYMNQTSNSAYDSLQLAMAFQKHGLDKYSLDCYQQALRLAPSSYRVNRQIGYYYLSKGNQEEAKNYLSRSFQINANQPEVAGELGRLGVAVKIPRKVEKQTTKIDKMAEPSGKEIKK